MKKIFSLLVCLFLSLTCVFGLSACGRQGNGNAVNLVAIDANSVGVRSDIEYFVVPEPAASAKAKATGLNFVGSLQSLYGGENGYPQAVVVAKNSLLETQFLSDFISRLSTSCEWLMSEDNSVKAIVDAIQGHLPSGLTPSITTNNLTKSVIENCGIKFASAIDSKDDILTFMEKFNSISENSFGMPDDGFFYEGTGGTADYTQKISVYAPDGAPALGIAKLMAENSLDNAEYHIIDPNTVQTVVGGADPKADICVLPVNLAVKLLGNAQNYKLIGTLTHGNLYILSKNGNQIDGDNLNRLIGKTVGVVNLAQVPGLTFKLILKNYGIEFIEPYND